MKIEMPCIVCPNSCNLEVEYEEVNGEKKIVEVSGNLCDRGITYATDEITHPMRMITTTIKITGSHIARLPVILSSEIPKEMIFDVVAEIKKVKVTTPVKAGDVLLENILGTGANLLSSRSLY
ncbi:MAG: DUF1667 domain-containing protein [Peptostreptococcaceae bacterium]|nr:DUF1667 domain-containing protein [Peptostreptococcaceae bacterium]